jgi:hypothetical protein
MGARAAVGLTGGEGREMVHSECGVQQPRRVPGWLTVGFTGHRRIANPERIAAAIHAALDRLAECNTNIAVVTSAAVGADTLFLEAAHARGLPVFLVLPAPVGQFSKALDPADWARLRPLVDAAIDCEVVAQAETPEDACLEAGILTADRAEVLLAVWDGAPATGSDGTGDVVAYAGALGKPVLAIHPETGRCAVHGALPPQTLPEGPRPDPAELRPMVQAMFDMHDIESTGQAPRAQRFVLRIVLLHLAATAIAIVSVTLHFTGPWAYAATTLKLAALLGALLLAVLHHRAQHAWLEHRLAAECCRAYLALWPVRRSRMAEPRIVAPALAPLLSALRMAWFLDQSSGTDLAEAKEAYLRDRVHGQIDHHTTRQKRSQRTSVRLWRGATLATGIAIVAASTALAFAYLGRKDTAYDAVKLASILLPLLSATLMSFIVGRDHGRRAVRYGDIVAALEATLPRIRAARNWPGLWRAVSDVETLLLQELMEWHAVTRVVGKAH